MQKKILFFVVAILCLGVGGWGYYLYQKPRAGVEDEKADYFITAASLYQAFAIDETAATKRFVDKVVRVQGTVQQIESMQGGINLILASNTTEGGVNCAISKPEKVPQIGTEVIVKGRCVGFLMDVSLVDAVLDQE
ncbi:MAG TPA: hypothetical protein VD794_03465 [Flavisolibacter sp.]|nr:hypothetical protein [Flavisolibacter sp.]